MNTFESEKNLNTETTPVTENPKEGFEMVSSALRLPEVLELANYMSRMNGGVTVHIEFDGGSGFSAELPVAIEPETSSGRRIKKPHHNTGMTMEQGVEHVVSQEPIISPWKQRTKKGVVKGLGRHSSKNGR